MQRTDAQYWTCQIGGWGAYSAVGLWTAVLENGWRPSVIIGYLLFFAYSIGLTHLLRHEIRRRHWTSLPMHQALIRLAAPSIAIGAVETALVVGVYSAIEGRLGQWSDGSSIAFLFMGVSVFNCIWTILYLTITTQRRSRAAERDEMQMKLALSDAELRALEAQLDPHFLFNCLNSIRGMISEDPPMAQDMVTRLANILRHNLQRDRRHTVPLACEMEAVSDYLALESIRFENRLRVEFALDHAARQSAVPPMLLQTLVENAIKHGVEEVPAGGDLIIRADVDDHGLRLEVENTGTIGEPRTGSTQIGLANARERLRILYGDHATLQLESSGEGRVTATVLIPATA